MSLGLLLNNPEKSQLTTGQNQIASAKSSILELAEYLKKVSRAPPDQRCFPPVFLQQQKELA